MPDIEIKNINNQSAGKMSLPDDAFGISGKNPLMHESVINHLANQRQGTHSTKTRGFVSGGGKKPYKQKGTGRARAGSSRSPLWRHGATLFGPLPRDYYYRMPKKARQQALYAALSAKIKDNELVIIDAFNSTEPKTSKMAESLNGLGVMGGSLLIVMDKADKNVMLSARNLPGVSIMNASDINAYEVLSHDKVLMDKSAMETLKTRATE